MRIDYFVKICLSLFSVIINQNRRSKVLYLHDIHKETCYAKHNHSMPISKFIDLIKIVNENGFSIVSEITESTNQIRLCFDDGYRGIWDCHNDLVSYGIFPTLFVATSLIGKDGYLSNNEIVELSRLGFSIQSHTVSHYPLTGMSINQLKKELSGSKEYLGSLLHKEIDELCLPLGYYNDCVLLHALKEYKRVFLSVPGSFYDELDKGIVLRVLVQEMSPLSLKYALFGGQDIFRSRIRNQHYHNLECPK